MREQDDGTSVREAIEPGTRVEVRNAFDRAWAAGFTVEEATADGYRLKRRSDGKVLPPVFAFDDVRRERRRSMWWV